MMPLPSFGKPPPAWLAFLSSPTTTTATTTSTGCVSPSMASFSSRQKQSQFQSQRYHQREGTQGTMTDSGVSGISSAAAGSVTGSTTLSQGSSFTNATGEMARQRRPGGVTLEGVREGEHRPQMSTTTPTTPAQRRRNGCLPRPDIPRIYTQGQASTMLPSTTNATSSFRFSTLLDTSLGSPFLTTNDMTALISPTRTHAHAYPHSHVSAVAAPPSPTPTDYTMLDMDLEDPGMGYNGPGSDWMPGSFPSPRQNHSHIRSNSAPLFSSPSGPRRNVPSRQDETTGGSEDTASQQPRLQTRYQTRAGAQAPPTQAQAQAQSSLKSLLPRLWDVISSPGRVLNLANAQNHSPSYDPSSTSLEDQLASHDASPPRRVLAPAQAMDKGKARSYLTSGGFMTSGRGRSRRHGYGALDSNVDYANLAPLDGDEGELIDEACFVSRQPSVDIQEEERKRGIDILGKLPVELALHVLMLLCASSGHSNMPHFSQFVSSYPKGTGTSPSSLMATAAGGSYSSFPESSSSHSTSPSSRASFDPQAALDTLLACRRVSKSWCRLASDNGVWKVLFEARWGVDLKKGGAVGTKRAVEELGMSWNILDSEMNLFAGMYERAVPVVAAPLRVDWRVLYRDRLVLDLRWAGVATEERSEAQEHLERFVAPPNGGGVRPRTRKWEPSMRRLEGHTDSVYCLEFDSKRIITGSRDRTIKVWGLKSGKLLGTFFGAHKGSVLCLKFEKDFDREWDLDSDDELVERSEKNKGFMVSGSSDCTVCVWDLQVGDEDESGERAVIGEVRAVLKGHGAGVLDLRTDEKWIVSCSKDTAIRVWNRETLELHRVLRGHEGPVNAVGLESGRVVSASGDGKMILWDISTGERLRTFDGHDRGLACIEFRDDLIVSGSNDCKIKVWRASTGECLRTLCGHEALVRALAFDPASGRLVSGSYDKSVRVWEVWSGKLVREFKKAHVGHIFDVKFDLSRIVSTSHDQKIAILDFSNGLDAGMFV